MVVREAGRAQEGFVVLATATAFSQRGGKLPQAFQHWTRKRKKKIKKKKKGEGEGGG